MTSKEIKYWSAMPFIVIGALVGLFILLYLRVEYYKYMDYQPNMGPQIAFFFFPFPLLFIILIAMPSETICRRFWYTAETRTHNVLIGMGYSTALTWWAFPGHWYLISVLNPITIRWMLGLARRSMGSAGNDPASLSALR
jgi:hypothetical protein